MMQFIHLVHYHLSDEVVCYIPLLGAVGTPKFDSWVRVPLPALTVAG
jgi:hypothetical protein